MARVTVEDCICEVPNRFDLVLIASQRSRELGAGAAPTIKRDNDKNPVVALREIAEKTISLEELQENLIQSHQKHIVSDEAEEEYSELLAEENSYAGEPVHETEIENLALDSEISDDKEVEMTSEEDIVIADVEEKE